jgi:DDE family transposase
LKLGKKFSHFFSEAHIEQVARESGFVKRKGKLSSMAFMDNLLFKEYDNGNMSLNDHSVDINVRHNIKLTKQSLDERFNDRSVAFVKSLLKECLQKQVAEDMGIEAFSRFSSVKIKDSTRFQLPETLKDHYPGSGGGASEAGAHVQFEFDIKTGKVSAIKPTSAKHQDTTEASESIEDIEEGSLVIRDLGYFSTKVLQDIQIGRKAYYISRLRPGIKIYTLVNEQYKELDLKKEYQDLKGKKLPLKELIVYIGNEHKVRVRLMIELMPKEQVEERMRKVCKEAKKKGRTVSKGYKAYAMLGLFVTNVPEQWLVVEHIRTLYRLRWQIELRFKCWKSLCRIHTVKKMKRYRFETYLYGGLLYILINWEISMALISGYRKTNGKMLSVYKCFKAIKQCRDLLRNALFQCKEKLAMYFKTIDDIDKQSLLLERRKGRLSLEEIMVLNIENE